MRYVWITFFLPPATTSATWNLSDHSESAVAYVAVGVKDGDGEVYHTLRDHILDQIPRMFDVR